MKKIYTLIVLLGLTIVSISQIFLWKDQAQMWQILNTQIQMLQKILDMRNSDEPFIYEDEMPNNYPKLEEQDA